MSTENNPKVPEPGAAEESTGLDKFHIVVLLSLVAVVSTVYVALFAVIQNKSAPATVPPVVSSFLDVLIREGDYETALDTYLVTSEGGSVIAGDSMNSDWVNFDLILNSYSPGVCDYEIRRVEKNYIEFILLTADKEVYYPAVGFAYRLTNDGAKIEDYTLCRLQPFSQRDAEYSEYWS